MQEHLLPKEIVSDLDAAVNDQLVRLANKRVITEVVYTVKSGKEATVYCCRAHEKVEHHDLLAVKIFRPGNLQGHKNMSLYEQGRVVLDRRVARAIRNKSRRGREFQTAMWTGAEYEVMKKLCDAGADTPEPIYFSPNSPPFMPAAAVVMEFIGDDESVAPMLRHANPPNHLARALFDQIRENIELFLAHDVIHGDLSPFNILYWEEAPVIIDFPQSVDPRENPNAFDLLLRDAQNVCRYFEKRGVHESAFDIADDLWKRWLHGRL